MAGSVFVKYQSPQAAATRENLMKLISDLKKDYIAIRDKPVCLYLGNNLALTKTVHGHKFFVDTRDLSLAPHILIDGDWEPWITKAFKQRVRTGMHIFDVGANFGWYSVLAASIVGPSGHVTAFEANPLVSDILFKNLTVNGFSSWSKVVPKAVYSESKTVEFNVDNLFMGGSSMFGGRSADEVNRITVEATSLDDYLYDKKRVDFLKIDAEGAEPFIIRGADTALRKNIDVEIMMEFSTYMITGSSGSLDDFISRIKDLKFRVWKIKLDSTLEEVPYDDLRHLSHCDVLIRR
jgi:FkbM family methyltransferase